MECYCLQKLVKMIPDETFEIKWDYVKNLQLADPKFNTVGHVDILIGADTKYEILEAGLIKGKVG